jgi:hypothetical protein
MLTIGQFEPDVLRRWYALRVRSCPPDELPHPESFSDRETTAKNKTIFSLDETYCWMQEHHAPKTQDAGPDHNFRTNLCRKMIDAFGVKDRRLKFTIRFGLVIYLLSDSKCIVRCKRKA